MIRPMPFWPSLEPWAKDTPVQVRIRRPRIQIGGGASVLGSWEREGPLTRALRINRAMAARPKPMIGLNSKAWNTLSAWPQSTPEVAWPAGAISWLARPTPITDPIRACDEELGMPMAQVPRFQIIAASSREKIMA